MEALRLVSHHNDGTWDFLDNTTADARYLTTIHTDEVFAKIGIDLQPLRTLAPGHLAEGEDAAISGTSSRMGSATDFPWSTRIAGRSPACRTLRGPTDLPSIVRGCPCDCCPSRSVPPTRRVRRGSGPACSTDRSSRMPTVCLCPAMTRRSACVSPRARARRTRPNRIHPHLTSVSLDHQRGTVTAALGLGARHPDVDAKRRDTSSWPIRRGTSSASLSPAPASPGAASSVSWRATAPAP